MRYTERLAAAGVAPSVGSVGDAFDDALAESVIGLFKTEVIHRRGPWRGFDDVEYATLTWVAWFNQQRLLAPLGYVPPPSSRSSSTGSTHRPPQRWLQHSTKPASSPARFRQPAVDSSLQQLIQRDR